MSKNIAPVVQRDLCCSIFYASENYIVMNCYTPDEVSLIPSYMKA